MAKTFNQIKHLVKAIPATKTIDGKTYRRFTSSFSEWSQNNTAKEARSKGMKVRKVVYRRAGRNVYTLYVRSPRER
jgi:flagellar basal body rod protein FlgC